MKIQRDTAKAQLIALHASIRNYRPQTMNLEKHNLINPTASKQEHCLQLIKMQVKQDNKSQKLI